MYFVQLVGQKIILEGREMINNFKGIMNKKNLTFLTISKDTGISRTTLRSVYYDQAPNVKMSTLIKLCDYLKCDLSELVSYSPTAKT